MNESRSEVHKTANIEAVLEAIIEIEKLKNISRRIKTSKTRLTKIRCED